MDAASPFRTSSLRCPRCRTALAHGELGFCNGCLGVWVPEAALYERVAYMQQVTSHDQLRLPWGSELRRALPCVACRAPMQTLALFAVPIDRCGDAHGIWFDRDELGSVLLASQRWQPPRPPAPTPIADATPAVLETAVATAGELTVWTVVEGVGEAVGAIVSAIFEL